MSSISHEKGSIRRRIALGLVLVVVVLQSTVPGLAFATGATFNQAQERQRIEQTNDFPNLANYKVLGPSTKRYNCVAWSLDITDRWVWPGKSMTAFDRLNSQHGYHRMNTLDFRVQKGMEKVALYGKVGSDGGIECTHQAKLHSDGSWSSKLGSLALVRYRGAQSVSGPGYGRPVAVYARPVRS